MLSFYTNYNISRKLFTLVVKGPVILLQQTGQYLKAQDIASVKVPKEIQYFEKVLGTYSS